MDLNSQQHDSRMSTSQLSNSGQIYGFVPMQGGIISFQLGGAFRSPLMAAGATLIPSNLLRVSSKPEAPTGEKPKKKKPKEDKKRKEKQKVSEERNYKCNRCGKSYLSYPALYTHTKLKHVFSKDSSSITNGRMRGRPKKPIVLFHQTIECQRE